MATTGAEDWQFDKFDDGSLKIIGEVQLRKYGTFLEEYATQLKEIEDALEESVGDSWDMTLDPITLQFVPYEQTSLLQLIKTDNKVLNKVITVLAALCGELSALKHEAENKFYPALMLYGEGDGDKGLEEGEAQIQIGRMMTHFQELSCFVSRCYEVVKQVLQQLASLYPSGRNATRVMDINDVHFQTVYEHLGDVLTVLITLDEIIESHASLKDHWTLYKRMLKSVRHNPSRFDLPVDQVRPFEKLMMSLEGQVLDGMIFQNCVEQLFDDAQINVSKNSAFAEEFFINIKNYMASIEPKIGESNETDQRIKFVGVLGLYVLHFQIYRTMDKKSFKTLWDVYKKVPVINLVGNVTWFPTEFLLLKLPQMAKALDKKAQATVTTARQQWLQQRTLALARIREAQSIYFHVSSWMVKMESNLARGNTLIEDLSNRCVLFIQGLLYAYNISHTVKSIMNLHVALSKPMTKTAVLSLCRLVELLKAIEYTFHRRSMLIAESMNHIIQHLSFMALMAVSNAKKKKVPTATLR